MDALEKASLPWSFSLTGQSLDTLCAVQVLSFRVLLSRVLRIVHCRICMPITVF